MLKSELAGFYLFYYENECWMWHKRLFIVWGGGGWGLSSSNQWVKKFISEPWLQCYYFFPSSLYFSSSCVSTSMTLTHIFLELQRHFTNKDSIHKLNWATVKVMNLPKEMQSTPQQLLQRRTASLCSSLRERGGGGGGESLGVTFSDWIWFTLLQ